MCVFNEKHDKMKYCKAQNITLAENDVFFETLNGERFTFNLNNLISTTNSYVSILIHKISVRGGSMRRESDAIKKITSKNELISEMEEFSKFVEMKREN